MISSIIGLAYAINDPMSKIAGIDLFPFEIGALSGQYAVVLFGLACFLYLVVSRISRYTKIVRDRMIAVIIFAFFTVFFWMSFEQGATSLVLFARDYVDRTLVGNGQMIFNIVNKLTHHNPSSYYYMGSNFIGKRNIKKNTKIKLCFSDMFYWNMANCIMDVRERILCNGIRNYRIMV